MTYCQDGPCHFIFITITIMIKTILVNMIFRQSKATWPRSHFAQSNRSYPRYQGKSRRDGNKLIVIIMIRDHHHNCDQDRDHLHLDHLDDHHTGVCPPCSGTWVHADSHKWRRRNCPPGQKRCRDIFLPVFLLIITRRWKTSLIRALLQLRS